MTKVQATCVTAATGGETNRTAVRTVAMVEDNRRPRDGTGESDCPILPMKWGNVRTLQREGGSEAVQ